MNLDDWKEGGALDGKGNGREGGEGAHLWGASLRLGLDALAVPSGGDVRWVGRPRDLALGKEVWATHLSLGVNSITILIISEAAERSKGSEIVQGTDEE